MKFLDKGIAKYPHFLPPGMTQVAKLQIFVDKEIVIAIWIERWKECHITTLRESGILNPCTLIRVTAAWIIKKTGMLPVQCIQALTFFRNIQKSLLHLFIHDIQLFFRHLFNSVDNVWKRYPKRRTIRENMSFIQTTGTKVKYFINPVPNIIVGLQIVNYHKITPFFIIS